MTTQIHPDFDPHAPDPVIAALKERLLAIGGERFQTDWHLARDVSPALAIALLSGGAACSGRTARLEPGDDSCHANAVRNVERHPGWSAETGFALSRDGIWRVHSWNRDAEGRIVETTVRRTRYFGVDATADPAFPIPSGEAAARAIERAMGLASEAEDDGDPDGAIRVIEGLLARVRPPLFEAAVTSCQQLTVAGRADEALAMADLAAALATDDRDRCWCDFSRANALVAAGRAAEGVAVGDPALSRLLSVADDADDRAALRLARVRLAATAGDLAPAVASAITDCASSPDPDEVVAFAGLLDAWLHELNDAQEHEQVVRVTDVALSVAEDPRIRVVLLGARASAAAGLRRWVEALDAIDAALSIVENDEARSILLGNRAWHLCHLGRPDEALSAADEALRLMPSSMVRAAILLNRALSLSRLQRYPEAAADRAAGLKLDPSNPNLWFDHACGEVRSGRLDAAFRALEKAVALDPLRQRRKALEDEHLLPFRSDPEFAARFDRLVQPASTEAVEGAEGPVEPSTRQASR